MILSRLAAAGAVFASMAAVLDCGGASDRPPPADPVAASGREAVPCSDRAETYVDQPEGVADTTVNGVTFYNLESLAVQYPAGTTVGGDRRWSSFLLVVGVPASRTATIAVPESDRKAVGLRFRGGTAPEPRERVVDASASVTMRACAISESRFSEGAVPGVGGKSRFGGRLVVAGSRCVRLEVAVNGRPASDVRFPVAGASCES